MTEEGDCPEFIARFEPGAAWAFFREIEAQKLKKATVAAFRLVFSCELLLRRLARELGAPMGYILFLRFLLFVARNGRYRRISDSVSPIAVGATKCDQNPRLIIGDHIRHRVSESVSVNTEYMRKKSLKEWVGHHALLALPPAKQ